MASDLWLRTILIVRKETSCCHIGYSYRLAAMVLLYAPSHRQDNTYHSLCYTSRGALAGARMAETAALTASIFMAWAFSLACSTAASPSILEASARDWASALAWPVLSTAALFACSSSSSLRARSASASSLIFWRSRRPRASCSSRSASCLKTKTEHQGTLYHWTMLGSYMASDKW